MSGAGEGGNSISKATLGVFHGEVLACRAGRVGNSHLWAGNPTLRISQEVMRELG